MDKQVLEKIKSIFREEPAIGVVYLFGSQARRETGPMSDYDFAVYFIEHDLNKRYDLLFDLSSKLSRELKTDHIDMININDTDAPLLKYQILQDGIVVFEREPYRVLIEPRILNEYFDFKYLLKKYNLTKTA